MKDGEEEEDEMDIPTYYSGLPVAITRGKVMEGSKNKIKNKKRNKQRSESERKEVKEVKVKKEMDRLGIREEGEEK